MSYDSLNRRPRKCPVILVLTQLLFVYEEYCVFFLHLTWIEPCCYLNFLIWGNVGLWLLGFLFLYSKFTGCLFKTKFIFSSSDLSTFHLDSNDQRKIMKPSLQLLSLWQNLLPTSHLCFHRLFESYWARAFLKFTFPMIGQNFLKEINDQSFLLQKCSYWHLHLELLGNFLTDGALVQLVHTEVAAHTSLWFWINV